MAECRGLAFTMDALIAGIALLLIMTLPVYWLAGIGTETAEDLQKFSLRQKGVFIADSLVKNRSDLPLLGSAKKYPGLKRVRSNDLDLELLAGTSIDYAEQFSVKSVRVEFASGKTLGFLEQHENAPIACIENERLVIVNGEKALVRVKVCE